MRNLKIHSQSKSAYCLVSNWNLQGATTQQIRKETAAIENTRLQTGAASGQTHARVRRGKSLWAGAREGSPSRGSGARVRKQKEHIGRKDLLRPRRELATLRQECSQRAEECAIPGALLAKRLLWILLHLRSVKF